MTDSELVQGLRRQEPAAYQTLCDCYLPSLWRYVYARVSGDQHLAEDITSETVVALLAACKSETAQEIINPGGWLRTVAGRRVQDHFRAVLRVRHLIEEAVATRPQSSREGDPAVHSEVQETRAQVREIMDQLSDEYRAALEWKYIDKLSVREIADRWATTEKSVESILFRARRQFRDFLVEQAGPDSAERACQGMRGSRNGPIPPDQQRSTPRTTVI